MKLLLVAVAIFIASAQAIEHDVYPDKFNNMDLDEILQNRQLLVGYMKCIINEGPCNTEEKDLKRYIADGLKTGCKRCTARQKEGVRRVIAHMIEHEPEYFRRASDKYDPDRIFTRIYKREFAD